MAGPHRTQRVKNLIAGYYDDWLSGMSLKQIADKYSVSIRSTYNYLQLIAENNGVKREDLLESPNLSVEKSSPKSPLRREHVQAEELRDQFVGLDKQLAKAIKTLELLLEENNENNKC